MPSHRKTVPLTSCSFFIEFVEDEGHWKGISCDPEIEDVLAATGDTPETCLLETLTIRRYAEIIKQGAAGHLSRDDLISQCEDLSSWYKQRKKLLSDENGPL